MIICISILFVCNFICYVSVHVMNFLSVLMILFICTFMSVSPMNEMVICCLCFIFVWYDQVEFSECNSGAMGDGCTLF